MTVREPAVETTPIPGLLLLRLPVHEDARGSFKEAWQRERMTALGLPDFGPVQHNVALSRRGVVRGFHAEPWDKLASVAHGRVHAAWVDLRAGSGFGTTFETELDHATAVFVPRGVANGYQSLEENTVYTYLVNAHWQPDQTSPAVDPFDETLAISWPVPAAEATVSPKDRASPPLREVAPLPSRRPLLLGARGQLGRALSRVFPEATRLDADTLDLLDESQVSAWAWQDHDVVLNAAGATDVEAAETPEGRALAWRTNAEVPATLAALARRHGFVLVHYSSDYVFDGSRQPHPETESPSPLNVYGQSKAAGDLAVSSAPQHYLLRTSWLVGEGDNFVRTMVRLAETGVSPSVVDDQQGRLTFADELARATRHLLDTRQPFGTYNCSNAGPAWSWADVARAVFEQRGRAASDVRPVTTEQYVAGRPTATRPAHSLLDLTRLRSTGFQPEDVEPALRRYLAGLEDSPNP